MPISLELSLAGAPWPDGTDGSEVSYAGPDVQASTWKCVVSVNC